MRNYQEGPALAANGAGLTLPSDYTTSPVNNLLGRLDKVRQNGSDRWMACCPAHQDKTPSLSVSELKDGRVLIHCFAGCAPADVVVAVGLSMADLFTDPPKHCSGIPDWKKRRIESAIGIERYIVEIAKADHKNGRLTNNDRTRAELAYTRIQKAEALLNG